MDYRTENGATLDYSYGSQPLAVTAVSGGQSFAYDASGQRVKTVQPDGRILYTPFPTYEEEVWPVAATTPIVTLTANGQTAVTIPPNTAYALQWQASNAFACEAGGSWSGSKPLNGSQNFKGFNSGSRTYSLTCSNVSGSTSRSVTVQIGYGFDLPLAVVIVPLDGPTSGQTTIQRSTYSLAGQAIAVRVAGSPLATNNGLLYLYSDHASALLSTSLGSASALVTSGGQKVNETRYLPFGGYCSGGPNAITDRGFTGQKENMEMGLLYYNARFYAPGLGRFLSADTIVPNPTNPQSLNRYSYTRNSPLNLIDPTGHRECVNFTQSGQCVPMPKVPTIPKGPMVTFTGNGWSGADQVQITAGAQITGNALAEIINEQHPGWYLSGEEAFKLVYHGSVTFNRTGGSCAGDARNSISTCGARTESRNLITVYTDADIITNKSHWARHELGHAFVHAVGDSTPIDLLDKAIIDNPNLSRGTNSRLNYGFASNQESPRSWQQSVGDAGTAHSEIWADMYLGWTSNAWEVSQVGTDRSTFMADNMPLLVDIALTHP